MEYHGQMLQEFFFKAQTATPPNNNYMNRCKVPCPVPRSSMVRSKKTLGLELRTRDCDDDDYYYYYYHYLNKNERNDDEIYDCDRNDGHNREDRGMKRMIRITIILMLIMGLIFNPNPHKSR